MVAVWIMFVLATTNWGISLAFLIAKITAENESHTRRLNLWSNNITAMVQINVRMRTQDFFLMTWCIMLIMC